MADELRAVAHGLEDGREHSLRTLELGAPIRDRVGIPDRRVGIDLELVGQARGLGHRLARDEARRLLAEPPVDVVHDRAEMSATPERDADRSRLRVEAIREIFDELG